MPGGNRLWQFYNEFYAAFEEACERADYDEQDVRDMPIEEYVRFIKEWITDNTTRSRACPFE